MEIKYFIEYDKKSGNLLMEDRMTSPDMYKINMQYHSDTRITPPVISVERRLSHR